MELLTTKVKAGYSGTFAIVISFFAQNFEVQGDLKCPG